MATELIATGSSEASSSDVVVPDGTPVTISLKGATGPSARVLIELKDDEAGYNLIGEITSLQPNAVVLARPGTYRMTRVAGATCGVFSG